MKEGNDARRTPRIAPDMQALFIGVSGTPYGFLSREGKG